MLCSKKIFGVHKKGKCKGFSYLSLHIFLSVPYWSVFPLHIHWQCYWWSDALFLGSHSNMSEGSSRSSQEGLDGVHSDSRHHQTALQRTQKTPGLAEGKHHPPVARVCTSPHVDKGRPRLQLHINPTVSSQRGHGVNSTLRLQSGVNTGEVSPLDGPSPPPYNAHHRLAGSQSLPQLATAQQPHERSSAGQSNSALTSEARVVPQSQCPEWQDWQRDRWQIWQLLSSDNADTLPETLVWSQTMNFGSVSISQSKTTPLLPKNDNQNPDFLLRFRPFIRRFPPSHEPLLQPSAVALLFTCAAAASSRSS